MEQISHFSSARGTPQYGVSENIFAALLAAAAKQHIPIASSPLNPDLRESDLKFGRQIRRMRKPRPVTRKGPELSPGLWLLRRKAALAHQRTKQSSPPLKEDNTVVISELCEPLAYMEEGDITDNLKDAMPAFVVESGPLTHIVYAQYVQHDVTADLEKQAQGDLLLPEPSQGEKQRQRLRFFFILCVLSACATLFTVFVFEMLRSGHYLSR
ncbi:hypothetical protein M406DRAFT_328468 [Cryphonectria parasitica EP155]|uniref:Uncharacterized protein n=1 Tax=Cryphonectria parasitica (strain ATCC 38755 / EP155) TaxID=660469 RepID=A0A9P4Y787_CRYP1|nr:uncharacterized protein M406DRAFT_328468 [Cryphonectria parasitica EP155]KAF3767385.1 hypothetical protein M406DRAFT_328468 [Cryphonectria parasitica EP155]